PSANVESRYRPFSTAASPAATAARHTRSVRYRRWHSESRETNAGAGVHTWQDSAKVAQSVAIQYHSGRSSKLAGIWSFRKFARPFSFTRILTRSPRKNS